MALQRSLGSLRLEAKLDDGGFQPNRVLVGKITTKPLATRVFRRFTIAKIVIKI